MLRRVPYVDKPESDVRTHVIGASVLSGRTSVPKSYRAASRCLRDSTPAWSGVVLENAMLRKGLLAAPLVLVLALVVAFEPASGRDSDTIFANGFENFTLTIDNYLAWCSVSVDGGVATANPPPAQFPSGAVVPLFGQPVSALFIWGYWRFTDVLGHDTSQNTSVAMTSDRTVFVCCPFTDGSGCPAD